MTRTFSRRLARLAILGLAACDASGGLSRLPSHPAVRTVPDAAATPRAPRTAGSEATRSSDRSPERVEADLPLRVSPVAAACRGGTIELPPDLEPCACDQVQTFIAPNGGTLVRAGDWCGPQVDEERGPPEANVRLEKVVLAHGEAARVRIVLRNPDTELRVYRASRRYLHGRFVKPSGKELTMVGHGSGPYNDEAMIELTPGGTAELVLEVPARVARMRGKTFVNEPLPRGSYAVEVSLGSLGGTRLLNVRID